MDGSRQGKNWLKFSRDKMRSKERTVGGRGEGGAVDRRDVLDLMHGRSRMTIDPRIPTQCRD